MAVNTWAAFAIYVLFMLLVYWPVFLGKRFFWEDFFNQEYPIREFCFYMVRFGHALPFWNPYSWAWSPLLSDAQSGFWYPTNLLQIAMTWLAVPHAAHLPVLVPETMTLLHLPFAALGVFVLLKKEFRVTGIAALLAGLCWGFGVRMVAEQNHSMQILQLALLPWETLLLMRAWKSWRHAIGLGILFGISFFAGQPQTLFFIAIFLGFFTIAESLTRWRAKNFLSEAIRPIVSFSLAMVLAVGISSIQLLPSMELVALSARQHLDFRQATGGAIHLGHIINFFAPKFYGEYPGFDIPKSPIVHDDFRYWEATFYWSALAEILALFSIVTQWKKRGMENPQSRYLFFFAVFSIFAFGYGLGKNFIVQWPIWRFVPLFDHFRAPNRMIWFLWFMGTLLTGVGLDLLLKDRNAARKNKRYFYWAIGVFIAINMLAIVGIFDYIFKPHTLRQGMWTLVLPSLVASVCTAAFLVTIIRKPIAPRIAILCITILIVGDLYYNDVTWYRNAMNRESIVVQDSTSIPFQRFRSLHALDHTKFLTLYPDSIDRLHANLGMFLRTPIEDCNNLEDLEMLNPLRLERSIPPVADSIKRMEIMGIATILTLDTLETEYTHPLPFLKLYHEWRVTSKMNDSVMLNDSNFDFTKEILLSESPSLSSGIKMLPDTAILIEYSENHLKMTVAASQPSVLLVNDLYYPAWHATVDGKETNILRAFTSLRAIPVSAGIHTVEVRYDDAAFDLGWKITLGTLGISLVALCMGRKQKNPEA
jgi:Bacterial membrane protein YfhO